MIWHYLEIVNAAADFETLRRAGEPFVGILPGIALPLPHEVYRIALVEEGLGSDGIFDQARREILLWRFARSLKLALAHEFGHLLYAHGLGAEDQAGRWRRVIEQTAVCRYLEEARETGLVLALSSSGDQIEVATDEGEVNYLLRWDELFSRAVAQYIAQESGDRDMLVEIRERAHPEPGAAYYPQHWSEADFEPVRVEIEMLASRLGWKNKPEVSAS
jgi:hypothetical protein